MTTKLNMTLGWTVLLASALAGPAQARSDDQFWASASASKKLGDKWQISQELVTRFSDNRNGLYEVEGATMVGYKLGKSVTLAAGYVHNPQYLAGDFLVMERRARAQLTFGDVAGFAGGKLSARLRVEHRSRKNVDATSWRLRPYLKFSRPFKKGGATSLTLSNETFLNLDTTSFQRTRGVDRMRNFIGVNTPLSKSLSLETGYLNQYGFVRNGKDSVDHVGSVALALNL